MPHTKVVIHYIWATKNKNPIISSTLKPLLIEHIKENARAKGIYIDTINCVKDHIHLLLSLGIEQTISNLARLIKGESSYWVNKQKILENKFEWQDDYIALSVSESAIDVVRHYIKNQEEHHRKISFDEEYNQFLRIFGMQKKFFG